MIFFSWLNYHFGIDDRQRFNVCHIFYSVWLIWTHIHSHARTHTYEHSTWSKWARSHFFARVMIVRARRFCRYFVFFLLVIHSLSVCLNVECKSLFCHCDYICVCVCMFALLVPLFFFFFLPHFKLSWSYSVWIFFLLTLLCYLRFIFLEMLPEMLHTSPFHTCMSLWLFVPNCNTLIVSVSFQLFCSLFFSIRSHLISLFFFRTKSSLLLASYTRLKRLHLSAQYFIWSIHVSK